MRTPKIGNDILSLDEVDSTNSWLLQEKQKLQTHGFVVYAKNQTAGRGRNGRSFVTPPNQHLTFSTVVHSSLALQNLGIYALASGIAVAHALRMLLDKSPQLKWPNDVLIEKKKVCGILVEVAKVPPVKSNVFVIGIGVNCLGTADDFPKELQEQITTLATHTDQLVDPVQVLDHILVQLESLHQKILLGHLEEIVEEWLFLSDILGRRVQIETQSGWQEGVVEGVSPEGYLLVNNQQGQRLTHFSGDVHYL